MLTKEADRFERTDRVIFLSKPLTGIMAEQYFDLATPEHFWCKRRFEALQKLADGRLRSARRVAEIGCGNGVLQRQIEDTYGLAPAGFDLHEAALRGSISRRGEVYCYDINERADAFKKAFDVILMFDVLEHIEDQDRFLDSARFHLTDGGSLIINVPALQWLYSHYDRVQGHQRRYTVGSLLDVARRNHFRVSAATYWGGPLIPVLALRKAILAMKKPSSESYATGFDSGGGLVNTGLYHLSRCEMLPQRLGGTSVMAVLEADPS
jgi:SAM-dependent methyltransferase